MKKNGLRISHYIEKSEVNGPGNRFTIWFQGCNMDCPGCFNQDLQDPDGGYDISIDDLFSKIRNTSCIDGVSYSGGEPFDQSENLVELSSLIKNLGLNILSYTGYTLEQIENSDDAHKKELLKHIDILIDGPFMKDKPGNCGFTGSTNQKIYFLNQDLLTNPKFDNFLNDTEIIINDSGIITITGFPDQTLNENISGDA